MYGDGVTCLRINCGKPATLGLLLRVQLHDGDSFDDTAQYCDEDFGWFYRSFSRTSYKTEVLGVKVLEVIN